MSLCFLFIVCFIFVVTFYFVFVFVVIVIAFFMPSFCGIVCVLCAGVVCSRTLYVCARVVRMAAECGCVVSLCFLFFYLLFVLFLL